MRGFVLIAALFFCSLACVSQDKPRVFITDSQSWEMTGSGGGANGAWGAQTHGGARPQTAEIVKTFGEKCPQVITNNIQSKSDYVVLLDHEGGKGLLRHRNKVAVFNRVTGDSIVSHSTLSLGGSVEEACKAIVKDWGEHGSVAAATSTAEKSQTSPAAAPVTVGVPASPKVTVSSSPDGADIEVDGNFMGNTPSAIELTSGDHTIIVKKAGYKDWERRLRLSGGDIKVNAELERQDAPPPAAAPSSSPH